MNSKSIWFIVFYVCVFTSLRAQDINDSQRLENLNLWLSGNSIGSLFLADEIRGIDGVNTAVLKNRTAFSNPLKMWLSWQYLRDEYEAQGMSIEEELLNAWVSLSKAGGAAHAVSLICQDSALFNLTITDANDGIEIVENFGFERNMGATPYEVLKQVRFSDPQACMNLEINEREIYSRLIPFLKEYYLALKTVDRYFKFEEIPNQDGSLSIRVKGLKSFITPRYHEQMELRFSVIDVNDELSKLCYQLTGEYSSGISEPGDFINMKGAFISELVDYLEELRVLIGKSLK